MNQPAKPGAFGQAKFRQLGASSGFEGQEERLGTVVNEAIRTARGTDTQDKDFTGREESLGLAVSTVIKTLNHAEVYPHEMNDALVKMTLCHVQFAKKHGLLEECVQDDIAVTSPMMKRVGQLIEKTGNSELALISVFDHTACFFHLVENAERKPGLVRYKSPFATVLDNQVPGQFNLTEQEIHEVWTKPRYHGYADIMGVKFEVSDLDKNGMITVTLVP